MSASLMSAPGRSAWSWHGRLLQILILIWVLCMSWLDPRMSQAQSEVSAFHIPVQSLADALTAFSVQSGVNVAILGKLPDVSVRAPLIGSFSHEEALRLLLQGTQFRYEFIEPKAVRILGPDIDGMLF